MKKKILTTFLLTLIVSLRLGAAENSDQANLPKVLIIGDSISIGYTPHVIKSFKGSAVVKHHKGNAQHTGTGLKKIEQWLGKTEWDLIHFNWGLWDLCHRHPESKVQGKRDKARGTVTTTPEQYEKNLQALVLLLKKTKAKLIWANTTVVPEKEAGRHVGDAKKYNVIATKVMKEHGIPINDLHTLSSQFAPALFVKPGDVHYTKEGYQKLAEQVTANIKAAQKAK